MVPETTTTSLFIRSCATKAARHKPNK